MKENKVEKEEKSKRFLRKVFCKRNRMICLFSFLGLLIIITIVPGGKAFIRNTIWSMIPTDANIVNLPAGPYEMGKKHGSELKYSIQLLCGIYVERVICKNDAELTEKYCSKAEKIFEGIDSRWNKEIEGLSEASGVDMKILQLANSFLDLGLYAGGCRQVAAFDLNSKMLLHAHNMDWDNLGGVGNLMVTVFRTEGGANKLATVHIGFPGMTGALTVINEKGISLGFNQMGISSGDCKGLPVFLKLREIAETCVTFEEAEKEIMNMNDGMSFTIMLADAKSLKTAVFERARDNIIKKRFSEDGIITSDNIEWCDSDMTTCSVDVVARETAIFNSRSPRQSLNQLKSVLRDYKVLLDCNIYSIIFDYKNNAFYLASGEIPAAAGEYVKHILFEEK